MYKLWQEYLPNFPKTARYSLGSKIDNLFTAALEPLFLASYASAERKLAYLAGAIIQLDCLKFFLRISWEIKALDNKKYVALSEPLAEVGRMLGGWKRKLETKTPPP